MKLPTRLSLWIQFSERVVRSLFVEIEYVVCVQNRGRKATLT